MKKDRLEKQTGLARIKFLLTALLTVAFLIGNGQVGKEITDAKVVLVQSVPMGYWTIPFTTLDKDALYSNITTIEYPIPNEGATNRSGHYHKHGGR